MELFTLVSIWRRLHSIWVGMNQRGEVVLRKRLSRTHLFHSAQAPRLLWAID